jgi:hypothetical protein
VGVGVGVAVGAGVGVGCAVGVGVAAGLLQPAKAMANPINRHESPIRTLPRGMTPTSLDCS